MNLQCRVKVNTVHLFGAVKQLGFFQQLFHLCCSFYYLNTVSTFRSFYKRGRNHILFDSRFSKFSGANQAWHLYHYEHKTCRNIGCLFLVSL